MFEKLKGKKEKEQKKEKKAKKEKSTKKKNRKDKTEGEEKPKSKKKLIIIAVVIVFLIAALVLFLTLGLKFFGGGNSIKIGYLCSNVNDTFQKQILDSAKEEARKNNFELIVKDADEDMSLQTEQITALIEDKVAGLIVVPVSTSEVEPVTEAANAAKVPIVYLNRNPFGDTKTTSAAFFIGPNEKASGEMQAQYLIEAMPQGGGVAILEGLSLNDGTVKRTAGNESVLKENEKFRILAKESGDWKRDQGDILTHAWLKTYGNGLNAILSNNDEMALGALDALEKNGRNDVLVFGIDATEAGRDAVRQGRLKATVFQDSEKQGSGAVKIMAKLLNEQKVKKVTILDTKLITKENVDN